ncbi:MAG: M23 family metallopeptidase [Pseudomonadota bacterium]
MAVTTVITLALAAPAALGARHCSKDSVCVEARWIDDGTAAVEASNTSAFLLTVTVAVSSEIVPDGREVVMQSVPAGQTTTLSRYTYTGPRQDRPRLRFSFDWDFGAANVDHDDDYLYRLPYAAERRYRVLQGYGSRFSHTGREHYSVDFDMPRRTPVHAARDGVVVDVVEKHGEGCWEDRCRRTANYIVVLHSDGSTGEYYHLVKDGALVNVGDRVARGQHIALSGNSGHTTMPHLHFGVYEAISWGRTQSINVAFDSADGVIDKPRRGGRYAAR